MSRARVSDESEDEGWPELAGATWLTWVGNQRTRRVAVPSLSSLTLPSLSSSARYFFTVSNLRLFAYRILLVNEPGISLTVTKTLSLRFSLISCLVLNPAALATATAASDCFTFTEVRNGLTRSITRIALPPVTVARHALRLVISDQPAATVLTPISLATLSIAGLSSIFMAKHGERVLLVLLNIEPSPTVSAPSQ